MSAPIYQRWNSAHPNVEPHGASLRTTVPHLWLRIHSLPNAKRYPDTDDEESVLLSRHRHAISHIAGDQNLLMMFSIWKQRNLVSDFGFEKRESFVVPPGAWSEQPRVIEVAGPLQPTDERLGRVILSVAHDNMDGVLIATVDFRRVICLYDGGADLFFDDVSSRDNAAELLREWVSSRPDGL